MPKNHAAITWALGSLRTRIPAKLSPLQFPSPLLVIHKQQLNEGRLSPVPRAEERHTIASPHQAEVGTLVPLGFYPQPGSSKVLHLPVHFAQRGRANYGIYSEKHSGGPPPPPPPPWGAGGDWGGGGGGWGKG